MNERPEAPIRDLLHGLTALVQRSLGTGRAVVLALGDDGNLQPISPADAAQDLVARALGRSGSSLRSVGGDPPAAYVVAASEAVCVPLCWQDRIVGLLYAEPGSTQDAFPPEFLVRLLAAQPLGSLDPAALAAADPPTVESVTDPAPSTPPPSAASTGAALRSIAEMERDAILQALQACRGNRTATARVLGISVRKLQYRLKEYAQQGMVVGS